MLASMPGSSPIRPQEPIKRRRGRPPKNNKSPEAFPTLTLQFQTSPDSGSPTAESNSNMMVKMGEPDAFTPLMKVSPSNPSSRKRRRRSNHHSDFDDSPSKRSIAGSDDALLTPMSLSSATGGPTSYVNAKTSDSLSQIVKGSSRKTLGANYSLATPPKLAALDRFGGSSANPAGPAVHPNTQRLKDTKEPTPKEEDQAGLVSYVDDDAFVFQLVVDEKGKAALSSKKTGARANSNPNSSRDMYIVDDHLDPARPSAVVRSSHTAGIDPLHNPHRDEFDPLKKRPQELQKPTLPSYATLLAASEPDSSPEKHIVPQTPQNISHSFSETPIYLQTDSNGPGSDLAFNLTPQFNAMMYSMMSINSPQQKRNMSSQQPFLNSQLELNQYSRVNGSHAHTIDTSELLGGQVTSPKGSSSDEGDARAALRRAFNRGK